MSNDASLPSRRVLYAFTDTPTLFLDGRALPISMEVPALHFSTHEDWKVNMLSQTEIEYPSLTPMAVQVCWKTPTEFPECPDLASDKALEEYAEKLAFGTLFANNEYCSSWVVTRHVDEDSLVVLTHFGEEAIKEWAVAHVSVRDGRFYHRSEFTFFTLQGALKHFCSLTGQSLDYSIDDDC